MHRFQAPRALLVAAVALTLVGSAQLAPSSVVLVATEPVPDVVRETQPAATKIISWVEAEKVALLDGSSHRPTRRKV